MLPGAPAENALHRRGRRTLHAVLWGLIAVGPAFPRDAQLLQVPLRSTETFHVSYVGGPLGTWLRGTHPGHERVVLEGNGSVPILEIHAEGASAIPPLRL
jgi:hypothetical protein